VKLELIIDSTVDPFKKYDFDMQEVLEKLKKLKDAGVDVKIIDVVGWTRDMLYELYMEAVKAAVKKGYTGYRIRKIFGSARDSFKYFGREVPALFVRDHNEELEDVYPHEEGGRIITISAFLNSAIQHLEK
jgi:hypothetical protein